MNKHIRLLFLLSCISTYTIAGRFDFGFLSKLSNAKNAIKSAWQMSTAIQQASSSAQSTTLPQTQLAPQETPATQQATATPSAMEASEQQTSNTLNIPHNQESGQTISTQSLIVPITNAQDVHESESIAQTSPDKQLRVTPLIELVENLQNQAGQLEQDTIALFQYPSQNTDNQPIQPQTNDIATIALHEKNFEQPNISNTQETIQQQSEQTAKSEETPAAPSQQPSTPEQSAQSSNQEQSIFDNEELTTILKKIDDTIDDTKESVDKLVDLSLQAIHEKESPTTTSVSTQKENTDNTETNSLLHTTIDLTNVPAKPQRAKFPIFSKDYNKYPKGKEHASEEPIRSTQPTSKKSKNHQSSDDLTNVTNMPPAQPKKDALQEQPIAEQNITDNKPDQHVASQEPLVITQKAADKVDPNQLSDQTPATHSAQEAPTPAQESNNKSTESQQPTPTNNGHNIFNTQSLKTYGTGVIGGLILTGLCELAGPGITRGYSSTPTGIFTGLALTAATFITSHFAKINKKIRQATLATTAVYTIFKLAQYLL